MTIKPVFTAAELDLIARALDVRADTFARVAMMSATVPDYEIAVRAARRHRALAKRIVAARSGTKAAPPATVIARLAFTGQTSNRNAGQSLEAVTVPRPTAVQKRSGDGPRE